VTPGVSKCTPEYKWRVAFLATGKNRRRKNGDCYCYRVVKVPWENIVPVVSWNIEQIVPWHTPPDCRRQAQHERIQGEMDDMPQSTMGFTGKNFTSPPSSQFASQNRCSKTLNASQPPNANAPLWISNQTITAWQRWNLEQSKPEGKERHVSIKKPVHAESKLHENSKRYPCATHGTQNPTFWKHESFLSWMMENPIMVGLGTK
jgi:hypothetical protein